MCDGIQTAPVRLPQSRTEDAVIVESLTVRYGRTLALDGVDLRLGCGLFGLLGPNGAGKTTLMRTLATLQRPGGGGARIFGHDVERNAVEIRQLLGYLPQGFQACGQLKAWEVLDYHGILSRMTDRTVRRRRIDELLERVGLTEVRNRRAGHLSGGMLQRLGVAQALLNDPRLLILDEPTVGLDPAERVRFRNFLGELSRGRVVILSTHIVGDIGSACDRLAILGGGRMRFLGRRQDLIEAAAGKVWRIVVPDAEYERIRTAYPITGMIDTPEGLEVRLLAESPPDGRWQPVPATLEDAYLWLLRESHRHVTAH